MKEFDKKGNPSREPASDGMKGLSKFLPMTDSNYRRRLTEYEVQVQDDYGKEPGNRSMGAIYGQLTPAENAALPAGEWQSFDITLVGRTVTVVLNGQTIVERQEIPGTTGGALDSREGEPGPIFLQGDHGRIAYRNLVLTPAN